MLKPFIKSFVTQYVKQVVSEITVFVFKTFDNPVIIPHCV